MRTGTEAGASDDGRWLGWPAKVLRSRTLKDGQDLVTRVWAPVMDMEGLIYSIMSRATDEVGRVQSREPRYNYMRKNFSAIVANEVTVE